VRPLGGYLIITGPDAPAQEYDTVQCRHCQRIVQVKPGTWGQTYLLPLDSGGYREEAGAYCSSCSGPLCLPCERAGGCEQGSRHWERQMERYEAKARLLRALGL
jgi:hypothetical protein